MRLLVLAGPCAPMKCANAHLSTRLMSVSFPDPDPQPALVGSQQAAVPAFAWPSRWPSFARLRSFAHIVPSLIS